MFLRFHPEGLDLLLGFTLLVDFPGLAAISRPRSMDSPGGAAEAAEDQQEFAGRVKSFFESAPPLADGENISKKIAEFISRSRRASGKRV